MDTTLLGIFKSNESLQGLIPTFYFFKKASRVQHGQLKVVFDSFKCNITTDSAGTCVVRLFRFLLPRSIWAQ